MMQKRLAWANLQKDKPFEYYLLVATFQIMNDSSQISKRRPTKKK